MNTTSLCGRLTCIISTQPDSFCRYVLFPVILAIFLKSPFTAHEMSESLLFLYLRRLENESKSASQDIRRRRPNHQYQGTTFSSPWIAPCSFSYSAMPRHTKYSIWAFSDRNSLSAMAFFVLLLYSSKNPVHSLSFLYIFAQFRLPRKGECSIKLYR